MTAHLGDDLRPAGERLADLRHQADELRRRLTDVQLLLDTERAAEPVTAAAGARPRASREAAPGQGTPSPADGPFAYLGSSTAGGYQAEARGGPGASRGEATRPGTGASGRDAGQAEGGSSSDAAADRTTMLLNHGRTSARRRLSRRSWVALLSSAAVVLACVLIAVVLVGQKSWPSSVATVRREAAIACRNPDVRSEPGLVNFACAKDSDQILWVFALLTSYDNPHFVDRATGRAGLEPITPTQGGELAFSLNLHHPYNPASPLDSLEVAARAINNIVGGATVTSASGELVVQPGLESSPQNCARYTGSAALTTRQGFPAVCARQITSRSGRMELVSDIYRKWLVGATTAAARDAAVLFGNADNPGNGRVQAILRQLSQSRQPA
ncbi:MAG TPA: hypothetical protein VGI64_16310 [Streptosporangiaceae bacterium]